MRIAALLLLCVSAAAIAAETPPAPGTPRDFQIPPKAERTLGNGLNVTYVEWGSIPKTAVTVMLRAGNLNEGDQTWLADLTGELLKEGAGTRSAGEIADAAASMGGGVSVSVGPDFTTLAIDVLSEHAPEAIALLADLLRRPQLPEGELTRIKRDFQRQLAITRSEPDSLASEAFLALLYPNHPYGKAYPSEAQLEAYTIDDVRRFHRENFGAARTRVYIAGRFERQALDPAIDAAFGDWAAGPAPLINPPQTVARKQLKLIDRPDAEQSTIFLGLPVIDPSHPDYLTLSLTDSILGGEFTSRITSNIRESKGYAYSPSSDLAARYRTGYWVEQADVATASTGPALKEIYAEIDRLRREPPASAEIKGMQNYRAGIFVLQNATRGALIGQLAFLDLHGLPDDYLTNFVQHVYAITPEQVSAAAQTYLRPEDMTLVIVGDLKKIRAQLKPLPQLNGVLTSD
jgi:predicted Zn-dependent peptidase